MNISTDPTVLSVFSTFSCTPKDRSEVLALIRTNIDWLVQQPGFLGAALYTGNDGCSIISYAQWKDDEALAAMLAQDTGRSHAAHMRELATVTVVRSRLLTIATGGSVQ
jgi:quinol monooxygenase YgiN